MRRTLAAFVSASTLAIPISGQAAAATRLLAKTDTKKTVTLKLVGIAAQADRWGTVKTIVTAKITGTGSTRKVVYTDLGGSYSYHTSRSQYIMSQSLPYLRQEFLKAQSANVQMVSGATNTSQAFEQSLQSALLKLPKK